MFEQSVIEKIGSYVYFLRDPRNNEVFYVGKGTGNRIFDHVACSLIDDAESEKLDRVREINKLGMEVEHFVLRHGLTDEIAFEVEAALIDFVGMQNLANLQIVHNSTDYGIKNVDEVRAMYSAPPLSTSEPLLLININKLFNREMTRDEIYEATRKSWVLGVRKDQAKYAVASYRGLTREVYVIHDWFKVGDRWGFNGQIADENTRTNLRYKSIAGLSKRGAANPIRYINC
jgi:hypothetical protein